MSKDYIKNLFAALWVLFLLMPVGAATIGNTGVCYREIPAAYRFDPPGVNSIAVESATSESVSPVFEVIPLMPGPAPEIREGGVAEQPQPAIVTTAEEPATAAGGESLAPVAAGADDGFDGIYNANNIPPDTMGCAGPEDILNLINVHLGVFGKDGTTKQAITSFTDFFSGLGLIDDKYFDPICIYDHFEKQFVIVVLNKSSDYKQSYFAIAVSSNLSAVSGWHKYKFDAQTSGSADTNYWADYPGIGYDTNALYITVNMFEYDGAGSSFRNAKLYAFKKSDLYNGSANVTRTDIFPITTEGGGNAFGIRPAINLGVPSSEYLVSCYYLNYISLWQVNDIFGGSPSLTANDIYNGDGSEYTPAAARQKGSSILLDTVGFRIMHPVTWRDNSLWFAHTVSPTSGGDYSYIRWRELNAAGDVSAITQNQRGLISNTGAVNVYNYFPAIAVDGETNVVISYSRSSTNEFAGAWYNSRDPDTTSGSMIASRLMKAGAAYYDCPWYAGNPERWGDYAANTIDPLDDTFWTFTEYARSDNRYNIWIQNVRPQDRAYLDAGTSNFTSGVQWSIKLRDNSTLAPTSCVVQSVTITNGASILPPSTNMSGAYLASNCTLSSTRFVPEHIGDNLQGENAGAGKVSGTIGLNSTNYTAGYFRFYSDSDITNAAYYADTQLISIPTKGRGTNILSSIIITNINPAYAIPGFIVEFPPNNYVLAEYSSSLVSTGTVTTGTGNNLLSDSAVSIYWENITTGSNGVISVSSGDWNGAVMLNTNNGSAVTNNINFYALGASTVTGLPVSESYTVNVINPAAPSERVLLVSSEYGQAVPPVGSNNLAYGTNLTCFIVQSPVVWEDAQFSRTSVCTGWVGTGSVPFSGSTTNTGSFVLTANSTIDWLWKISDLSLSNQTVNITTNYIIDGVITAGDGYTISPSGSVTFSAGNTVIIKPGFHAETGSTFRAFITP